MRSHTARARTLRTNSTEVEAKLWQALRGRQLGGFKFRRQFPIDRYVADFACIEAKLVVELDGSQHSENPADAARTRVIEACGFHVIRFWNFQVNQEFDGVLDLIREALHSADVWSPSPSPALRARAPPSPQRGEGS